MVFPDTRWEQPVSSSQYSPPPSGQLRANHSRACRLSEFGRGCERSDAVAACVFKRGTAPKALAFAPCDQHCCPQCYAVQLNLQQDGQPTAFRSTKTQILTQLPDNRRKWAPEALAKKRCPAPQAPRRAAPRCATPRRAAQRRAA
eukprot:gene12603-biopygen6458